MSMSEVPFTILDVADPREVPVTLAGERVRLSPAALRAALDCDLTPEGLCHGTACVPLPPGSASSVRDGIDLEELAALLDRPLALDVAERAACLGASAGERSAALASLDAPDFTLPDLDGRLHSLAAQRGRKVLLVVYASW